MARKSPEAVWEAYNKVNLNEMALAKAFDALADSVEDNFNDLFTSTLFLLFSDIVKNTPRDTGLAQGNWQIADTHNDSVLDNKAQQNLLSTELNTKKTIYIFNNLAYIEQLEAGSSTKGDHMVSNGLNNWTVYVRQATKDIKGFK